jgi:LuxR family maltose regulon positive regulatory protein
MSQPLLTTKLHPPANPSHLIRRNCLLEQLDTYLVNKVKFQCKLTLISAPAGYGKTTLIVEWLNTRDIPYSWLSLESGDNDPIRFFTYLAAALQQIDPTIGRAIDNLLQSGHPPPAEVLLNQLIHEITTHSSPFILALDDYHEITNPEIHQALVFLLEHQPSQMHLVLLTREDPSIPLARLRSREQVIDIRQDGLRFTVDEVAQYLRDRLEIELYTEDVQTLHRRIEGWPVGLQLACLLLQGKPDIHDLLTSLTGGSRYIMDYLVEEVLDQQPPDVQDFLLQTSILDRFCAALCDSVTGREDGSRLLQLLEQANLFLIPLDHTREWYRYHRLFADLLRHRLRMREPSLVKSLYSRASIWFEAQQMLNEAIDYALAADDWERAGRLILKVDNAMLKRGEITSLLNWYKKFPEDVINADLYLCLGAIWPLMLSGQLDPAAAYINQAETLTSNNPQVAIEVMTARAYLAWLQGDIHNAVEWSTEVLLHGEEIDADVRSVLWLNLGLAYWHQGLMGDTEKAFQAALPVAMQTSNHYVSFTARLFQARVFAVRAQLQQASQILDELVKLDTQLPVMALVHMDLGYIHYEWNNLEKAAYYLESGLKISQKAGNNEFLAASHMGMMHLHLSRGDIQGAETAARSAHELAIDHGLSPQMTARINACLAQVMIEQGKPAEASTLIDQMPVAADPHPFYRYMNMIPARLMLAEEHKESASIHLAEQIEQACQMGWQYGFIVGRIYQALAARHIDDGCNFLADALEAAHAEGVIRSFIEAGPDLVPMLHQLAQQGIHPAFIRQILDELQTGQPAPSADGLLDPLSEREVEVLNLLVAGLTNPEIAEQLIISLGTVKTHVHNIYSKLAVRNRAEAIARATELNLLK